MYPSPKGNKDLVNSLYNGLLVFCIKKGLPLSKNRQSRIGVELYSGSRYNDLKWHRKGDKEKTAYQIKIIRYSPTHGVFKVMKNDVEDPFLHKELMQCIEEELAIATSHVRSG